MLTRLQKVTSNKLVQLEVIHANCRYRCDWVGHVLAAPENKLSLEAAKFVLTARHTKETKNCTGELSFYWGSSKM